VKDKFFATSFSDLFRPIFRRRNLQSIFFFNITFYERKQLLHERIRDHITNMMRLVCVSELLQMPSENLRISLEISMLFKTQNTDRRMFGATSSYLFLVVLQLVDDREIGGPSVCALRYADAVVRC
jgi:hypothetical protein